MELSIKNQCELLGISRSAYYYTPKPSVDEEEIRILKAIVEELNLHPFYGYRKIAIALKDMGVTRKQIRLIMQKAGLRAIYPGKRMSMPIKWHEKYPYLLKDKLIWLPNQVWAADITYLKLSGGHVYLVAIIDLFSRKTLSWRLSNTLDTEFCISALDEAIMIYGKPAIFNTDQGSQFTSDAFTDRLKSYKIRISMDSKGRALDNIFIERLWRSLKYEEIYLNEYRSMEDLKISLKKYFHFYNSERFHQSLEYATPDEMYNSVFNDRIQEQAA
jgi:putative transposase